MLARSPYFLFLVYIRLDQTQQNRDIMVSEHRLRAVLEKCFIKKVTLLNQIFFETLYHDAKDLIFLKLYSFKL